MFSKCFLSERDPERCRDSRGVSGVFKLSSCSDNVRGHLESMHISGEIISEGELILARVGMFNATQDQIAQMEICPYHRHKFGRFWRPSKRSCHYPTHAGVPKLLKGKDVNTLQISKDVQKLYGVFLPVGARKSYNFNFVFLD